MIDKHYQFQSAFFNINNWCIWNFIDVYSKYDLVYHVTSLTLLVFFIFFFRSISPARWTSHTNYWTFPWPQPWTIPPQSPIPNPLSIRSSAKSTGTVYQFPRQSTVRCGLRLFIWASWRARALLFKWVFVLLLF